LDLVSGTTGFDYRKGSISGSVLEQAAQCIRNIAEALAEAGGSIEDVVRVRYIFPDPADFEPCWPLLRQHFGPARPAATMISAGLADPRMKIEIEVTAKRCSSSQPRRGRHNGCRGDRCIEPRSGA
jgi:enamine deaminase RidA (YjgF/YER057c/UK114 family)